MTEPRAKSPWQVLRDPAASVLEKTRAFDDILGQVGGEDAWWSRNEPLLSWTKSQALGVASATLNSMSLPGLNLDCFDCEGLAHDALIILMKKAPDIKKGPRAYLLGIIRMLVMAAARDLRPFIAKEDIDSYNAKLDEAPAAGHAAEDVAAYFSEKLQGPEVLPEEELTPSYRELYDQMRDAINSLPPRLRAAYLLKERDNLDTKQIAEALNTSKVNVRQLHARARRALTDEFKRRGFPAPRWKSAARRPPRQHGS